MRNTSANSRLQLSKSKKFYFSILLTANVHYNWTLFSPEVAFQRWRVYNCIYTWSITYVIRHICFTICRFSSRDHYKVASTVIKQSSYLALYTPKKKLKNNNDIQSTWNSPNLGNMLHILHTSVNKWDKELNVGTQFQTVSMLASVRGLVRYRYTGTYCLKWQIIVDISAF